MDIQPGTKSEDIVIITEKKREELLNLSRVKTLIKKYEGELASGTIGQKANAKKHLDKLRDLEKLESYFTERIGSGEPEEDEVKDEEALNQIQEIKKEDSSISEEIQPLTQPTPPASRVEAVGTTYKKALEIIQNIAIGTRISVKENGIVITYEAKKTPASDNGQKYVFTPPGMPDTIVAELTFDQLMEKLQAWEDIKLIQPGAEFEARAGTLVEETLPIQNIEEIQKELEGKEARLEEVFSAPAKRNESQFTEEEMRELGALLEEIKKLQLQLDKSNSGVEEKIITDLEGVPFPTKEELQEFYKRIETLPEPVKKWVNYVTSATPLQSEENSNNIKRQIVFNPISLAIEDLATEKRWLAEVRREYGGGWVNQIADSLLGRKKRVEELKEVIGILKNSGFEKKTLPPTIEEWTYEDQALLENIDALLVNIEKRPFKWFLIEKMHPINRLIVAGHNALKRDVEQVMQGDIKYLLRNNWIGIDKGFANDDYKTVETYSSSTVLSGVDVPPEQKQIAAWYSTNGFYLVTEKMVGNYFGGGYKKESTFRLIHPDGSIIPGGEGLDYEKGEKLLEEQAQRYQDRMISEFNDMVR